MDFGPDPLDRHVTTYFRHAFQVPSPAAWNALVLRLLRDDGATVYLNGVEVYRYNLPILGLTSQSLAASAIVGAGETSFFETRIDHHALRAGTNVLAVEIHQADPTSDDLSFDLELLGRR